MATPNFVVNVGSKMNDSAILSNLNRIIDRVRSTYGREQVRANAESLLRGLENGRGQTSLTLRDGRVITIAARLNLADIAGKGNSDLFRMLKGAKDSRTTDSQTLRAVERVLAAALRAVTKDASYVPVTGWKETGSWSKVGYGSGAEGERNRKKVDKAGGSPVLIKAPYSITGYKVLEYRRLGNDNYQMRPMQTEAQAKRDAKASAKNSPKYEPREKTSFWTGSHWR